MVAHGQTACIVGDGFGTKPGKILFYTGGQGLVVSARIESWANTLIEVVVPDTALTGPVEAETANENLSMRAPHESSPHRMASPRSPPRESPRLCPGSRLP